MEGRRSYNNEKGGSKSQTEGRQITAVVAPGVVGAELAATGCGVIACGAHSLLQTAAVGRLLPSITTPSDASGMWRRWAVRDMSWVQLAWPTSWIGVLVEPREMVSVVLTVVVFGSRLRSHLHSV